MTIVCNSRMEKEMEKSNTVFHGSDLEKIEMYYGIRKEDIVSFSANVNPLGLSDAFRNALAGQLDVITSYPDRDYKSLKKAIAYYCQCNQEHVLVGNGSTELISLIIRLCRPGRALVLGPTYSEYERELLLAGKSCTYVATREEEQFVLKEEALTTCLCEEISLLILCNPNNPTSSLITRKQMERILEVCKRFDILVMVDETYMEFVPDADTVTAVSLTGSYDNLVVLRGVSKFFAAPGLRLGYAVTGNAPLLSAVSDKQNPWAVSSLADAAGQLLFSDKAHIEKTRKLIDAERTRIYQMLSSMDGLRPYKPHANFILVRIVKDGLTSVELFDMAIRRGLMIRDCSSFFAPDSTYFRFCFMLPKDNDRLLSCIREFLA